VFANCLEGDTWFRTEAEVDDLNIRSWDDVFGGLFSPIEDGEGRNDMKTICPFFRSLY